MIIWVILKRTLFRLSYFENTSKTISFHFFWKSVTLSKLFVFSNQFHRVFFRSLSSTYLDSVIDCVRFDVLRNSHSEFACSARRFHFTKIMWGIDLRSFNVFIVWKKIKFIYFHCILYQSQLNRRTKVTDIKNGFNVVSKKTWIINTFPIWFENM